MLWRLFLGFSAAIAVLLIGEYVLPNARDIRMAQAFWTNEHFSHKDALAEVDFQITRDWGTGLIAKIFLKNTGWKSLRDWTLFLDLPRGVTTIKGGVLTARAGSKIRIDAPARGLNAVIQPGATIQLELELHPGGITKKPARIIVRAEHSPFTGAKFPYAEALKKSLLFYEAQRSGALPANNRIPWRGDSALQDGADVGRDLSGGYYDAGDHVKFAFPLCSALTLLSWGGLEYGDGYRAVDQWTQLLATVRWGTDWLIKAHPTPHEFYAQVGSGQADHDFWGPPEAMTMPRPALKIDETHPGSDLAGEAAASLAAASLLFAPSDPDYARTLREHAESLFEFADTFRGKYSDSLPEARLFYESTSGFHDELVWAATWLYLATERPEYLQRAEADYAAWLQGTLFSWTQTWDDKRYGAAVLLAQVTGKEIYRRDVETFLNHWTIGAPDQRVAYTPGGLAWIQAWGALRYTANTAFLALVYSDTVNDPGNIYHAFAKRQINYILGDNPANRSYVVGFGENSPRNPHHRGAHGSSEGTIDAPTMNLNLLEGALVGGPFLPDDFAYSDDRRDERCNEVALDYNAAFSGALARMVMLFGGTTAKPASP